jgi:hypothetical protein
MADPLHNEFTEDQQGAENIWLNGDMRRLDLRQYRALDASATSCSPHELHLRLGMKRKPQRSPSCSTTASFLEGCQVCSSESATTTVETSLMDDQAGSQSSHTTLSTVEFLCSRLKQAVTTKQRLHALADCERHFREYEGHPEAPSRANEYRELASTALLCTNYLCFTTAGVA